MTFSRADQSNVLRTILAQEDWLEKEVRNPETGNIVKVKSLPLELREKYRPKKSGPEEVGKNVQERIEEKKNELKKLLQERQKPEVDKKQEPTQKPEPAKKMKAFADTTLDERLLTYATYKDIGGQMKKDVTEVQHKKPVYKPLAGKFNVSHLDTIKENVLSEISATTNYLASDCVDLAHKYANIVDKTLRKYADEFSENDAENINKMITDGIQKLIYQESESNKQQFTDHGIRHIVKNIDWQQKILDLYEKRGIKTTGRDRLMGIFAMVNHDVGYTVSAVRDAELGNDDIVKYVKEHKDYSTKIAEEQRDQWNEGKIFSKEEYDRALEIIRTHDKGSVDDSDPVAFATRLADNFALFHEEKLPAMFKYVSTGKQLLLKMGEAAKNKDVAEFEKNRNQLDKDVDASNLNVNLKRDMKKAVERITNLTPKFTMGTLAGEVESITDDNGMIVFNIKTSHYEKFLQTMFDMGQKQVKKVLGDYGITDFDKTRYEIGGKVVLNII